MIPTRPKIPSAVLLLAACGVFPFAYVAIAQDDSPQGWLDRMSEAMMTTSYEGTVVRIEKGKAEPLKVVRTFSEGVVQERLVNQEGNGLEIIRKGNEVHCILPEKRSVLVEQWDDQKALFSTLPSSRIRVGNEYGLVKMGEARVAGRRAVILAIRPLDSYRYGHRIWLDADTGFPLKTQLLGVDNSPLEELMFADVRINHDVDADAFAPSYNTRDFKWFNRPGKTRNTQVELAWRAEALPSGFEFVSGSIEPLPGSEAPVTHLVFSDGLANVSVFITPGGQKADSRTISDGASNSHTTLIDGHRVTAVGDVPAATVEQIAVSMTRS